MGINYVTGDYSRGAAGFWIQNGAARLAGQRDHDRRQPDRDVPARSTPADDLEFRYGIDAPTLRIDGMTVAGQ